MGYKKKFNKDKIQVTITATGGSMGFWVSEEKKIIDIEHEIFKLEKKKTFEVVKKEEIYKWIEDGKIINIQDKYIKGFSLIEYSDNKELEYGDKVMLKNFNAKGAFFDRGADFSFAVFDEAVSFAATIFEEGDVSFEDATFGEDDIYFDFATFSHGKENSPWPPVSFARTNFGEGNVYFRNLIFEGAKVSFEHATFGEGDVFFGGTIFDDASFETIKILGDWNMRVKKAETIDFSNSLIHGMINFTGAKMNQLKLIDTKLTGKLFISSEELHLNDELCNQNDAINSQKIFHHIKKITHKEKRDQFRLLKENFHNLGQYNDEDKAYRWFMYHKIRAEKVFKEDNSLGTRIKKSLIFNLKWLFFEKIGLYGTSPFRVALSMFVVIGLFALLYLPFSKNARTPAPFFHSIITFLTIGYGTEFMAFESFWFKFLSGVEGFAGLFLMSYFTISFVRKVLR